MNLPTSYWKKSLLLIFAVISTIVVWGVANHFVARNQLEIPLVLIYSKDTAYDEIERKQIRRWLKLNSKDKFFEELEQEDTQMYSSLPHFLMHLSDTSTGDSQNRHLFKLSKPSTLSKKMLRGNLEESFLAEKRLHAFRSIVVVLDLDALYVDDMGNFNYIQFEDDLIYIKHNFSAVGLLVSDTNEARFRSLGGRIKNVIA